MTNDLVSIDSSTGILSITNKATEFIDEQVIIIVTTTGGEAPYEQRTMPLQVITECSPDSTEITAPELPTIEHPVNYDSSLLSFDAAFTSSNELCPIRTVELDDSSQQHFELIMLTDGFRLRLRPSYQTELNTYTYNLVATASGEGQQTASGTMTVADAEYICENAVSVKVPADVTLDIPKPGNDYDEVIIDFGPYSFCFDSYGLEMSDGSALPPYFTFDSVNGVYTLENAASRLVDNGIVLVLTSGDEVQRTDPIAVKTVCGPGSTDIVPPVLENLVQGLANANLVLSVTDSFASTNEMCPITSYELMGDGGNRVTLRDVDFYFDFNVANDVSDFAVRLKDVYQEIESTYYYTVQATAEGSAYAISRGYMEINSGIDCTTARLSVSSQDMLVMDVEGGFITAVSGTFGSSIPQCKIEEMFMTEESAEFFELTTDDTSFTVTRISSLPAETDPEFFIVYAVAFEQTTTETRMMPLMQEEEVVEFVRSTIPSDFEFNRTLLITILALIAFACLVLTCYLVCKYDMGTSCWCLQPARPQHDSTPGSPNKSVNISVNRSDLGMSTDEVREMDRIIMPITLNMEAS